MGKLRKEFIRSLYHTRMRYCSIILIVALGVAFFTGIRAAEPDMKLSADHYFDEVGLWDLRVLSADGMKQEDVERISRSEGVEEARGSYSREFFTQNKEEQLAVRVMSLRPINSQSDHAEQDWQKQIVLKEGRMPDDPKECLMDYDMKKQGYRLGDKVRLSSGDALPLKAVIKYEEYTITGFASHPYYLSIDRGNASIGNGKLDGFLMVQEECFQTLPEPIYSEVLLTVKDSRGYQCFSKEYESLIEEVKKELEALGEDWYVLDRNSIQTYQEYGQDTERIGAIGAVFPLIFYLVAALVCLTTMTRMVEEERTQIGTLKALGYHSGAIAAKYICYGFSAAILGSILGILLGKRLLPYIVIKAYAVLYNGLPEILTPLQSGHALTSMAVSVLCTTTAAVAACYRELLSVSAQLMRPEAPKSGKRVFMERIGFLWRRLSFSNKAAVRNLIRYKKRFFMTIFGIGSCTALILVGFGLKDSIATIGKHQFEKINLYDVNFILDPSKDRDSIYKDIQKETKECMYVYENSFYVGNDTNAKSSYLIVPEDPEQLNAFVQLQDRKTKQKFSLDQKRVIITEKLSRLLDVQEGDYIYIKESETKQHKVQISAISENYFMHYVFMSPSLYQEIFGKAPVYNGVYANFKEERQGTDYEKKFFETFASMEGVSEISFTSEAAGRVSDMMKSMDAVVAVLVISAGLLTFIVLFNLNNINISERVRELATIKVLGFYNRETAWYIYRENICLTVIGAIVGLLLGVLLHRFVIVTAEIDLLMFSREIRLRSFLYGILLTFLFAMAVNLFMYRKICKIDMIQSLKSVE